ncbi:hypothetical protein NDU88_000280 [Pleurodeles waltl]|uniref:Uncharacterized protein n=1 Tax=Pleurodeles waltl TaxID=8319 RepID=A0AAV7KT24_PLEWA|nr:hypothetical protein NDU88_000280 [Pleurodeles waltl]
MVSVEPKEILAQRRVIVGPKMHTDCSLGNELPLMRKELGGAVAQRCDDLASAATSDPEVQRPSTNPHLHLGHGEQSKNLRAMPRLDKRDGLEGNGADVWHRGSWRFAVEKEEDQEDGAASQTKDPTGNLPGSVDLRTSGAGGAQR